MLQHLRYAIRTHLRSLKIALIMILTLALGIGSAISVFTVVRAVLLRPLLYPRSQELVRLFESNPGKEAPYFSVSPPNWMDWKASTKSFRDMGALTRAQNVSLNWSGERVEVTGARISSNLLPVLGISITGKNFTGAADRKGQEHSVILNYSFWKNQLGGDESVLGRTLVLDDQAHEVIGITAEGFHLPFGDASLYLPLGLAEEDWNRSRHFLRIIGRLKSGVSLEQALPEMKAIAFTLEKQYPDSNQGWSVSAMTVDEIVVPPEFRRALWILFAAVALVLLIACLNVVNLLTARIIGRRREISIRRAIGAGDGHLFTQFLSESFVISLLAGTAGILLASWCVELLQSFEPSIPRLQEIRLDSLVFVFTIGVTLFTVLVFAVISYVQGLRPNVQDDLKEASLTTTSSTGKRFLRNALVVIEASLSIVLLIGAGLLIKSFLRLQSVDLGFHPEGVIAVRMTLPEVKATDPGQIRNFHSRVLDRLKGQTGIANAAIANHIPFGLGNAMEGFRVEGREESYGAAFRVVTDQYFDTMGVPTILGRGFNGRTNTIIIDATIKKRFWPNENPIGKKITILGLPEVWHIGGIVGDVRGLAIEEDPLPTLYLLSTEAAPERSSYLVVRTPVDSESLRATIQQAIREASPDAIIAAPVPAHQLVAQTLAERQFNTWVLGIFAAVALLLAAVGLYSVIGYSVSQRTHEIGIRMALGASTSRILMLIVKEGFLLAAAGILIGLLFAFTSTRILASLLYGVNPTDALTFYACGLLFLFVAVLASYFPARRAALLDPLVALKYE